MAIPKILILNEDTERYEHCGKTAEEKGRSVSPSLLSPV